MGGSKYIKITNGVILRPLVFSCALLFANEECSETEEQKAGLLEEEMEEKLAGFIAGKEAQAAFG